MCGAGHFMLRVAAGVMTGVSPGDIPSIELVESIAHPATEVILDGLRAFNEEHLGRSAKPIPLTVYVRDGAGAVQGGLIGQYLWEWLYVDKFWMSETIRGNRTGSAVLARAEQWAYGTWRTLGASADARLSGVALLRTPRVYGIRCARELSTGRKALLPQESAPPLIYASRAGSGRGCERTCVR